MRAFIRTCLVVLAFVVCAARADWPMAGHDPARSNGASEAITGPFTYRWTQFFDEKVTRAQVIVAAGKALVGTLHGSVIAMDAATGRKLWQAKAGGPIYGSVASDGRAVFAASQDGRLYAFDLAGGKALWQFSGAAGSICHPLVIDGMVIYADKSGALYAVSAGDGTLRWRYQANAPILASPAAWKGRVFVGSEDMVAHGVDLASGKGLWRSQLYGMGLQETWPVCTMDIVLFTSRAYSYGGASLPIQRTIARHAPNPTEEQSIALQDGIIREIRENPALRQTFFALDIETGKEAFTPPFAYNTGRQGPPTPPCVAPDGHVWSRFYFVPLTATRNPNASQYECVHIIKMNAQTGRFMSRPFHPGILAQDETSAISVAGTTLFNNEWGYAAWVDTATGQRGDLYLPGFALTDDKTRGRYPGWMGATMQNSTLAVSVAGGRVYGVGSSYIVCYEGAGR